jgi:acetyl esterase/lipase
MKNSLDMLELKTRKFIQDLEAQGGPPIYQLSVEKARDVLNQVQEKFRPDDNQAQIPAQIQDETLPVGPNGSISIRIVRPQIYTGTLPIIMYFHGGGWVLGNQETHDRLIREISNKAQAAVVFVNYTSSPEAKFPIAIEEAYAATRFMAEHAEKYNLDASRIAVMGDSVGGNMATVTAMLAMERKGPPILCQILCYPVTDANFETNSYREFATGFWLTREAMKWFWNNYLPDEKARMSPFASPLQATPSRLQGMPTTLLITDENDVLRDEGEAYAHKLMNAGVRVVAVRIAGTIHDFMLLNSLADTPPVRAAIETCCHMLKDVFSQAIDQNRKKAA